MWRTQTGPADEPSSGSGNGLRRRARPEVLVVRALIPVCVGIHALAVARPTHVFQLRSRDHGASDGSVRSRRAGSQVEIKPSPDASRLPDEVVHGWGHGQLPHLGHESIEVDPRARAGLARVDLPVADHMIAVNRYRPSAADLLHETCTGIEHGVAPGRIGLPLVLDTDRVKVGVRVCFNPFPRRVVATSGMPRGVAFGHVLMYLAGGTNAVMGRDLRCGAQKPPVRSVQRAFHDVDDDGFRPETAPTLFFVRRTDPDDVHARREVVTVPESGRESSGKPVSAAGMSQPNRSHRRRTNRGYTHPYRETGTRNGHDSTRRTTCIRYSGRRGSGRRMPGTETRWALCRSPQRGRKGRCRSTRRYEESC